jgi:hypothetical protein
MPHIDYTRYDFPYDAYVPPVDDVITRITRDPPTSGTIVGKIPHYREDGTLDYVEYVVREMLKGQPGADMDVIQSILFCASKEMDAKSKAMDNKLAVIEADIKALKDKIK